MIDDQRLYPIFLNIASKNNIKTFGYMHYKFTKYAIPTSKYEFDNFLVWSDYFKTKLFNINKNYKKKNLFYYKTNYEKVITNNKRGKEGILYIIDQDANLDYFTFINICFPFGNFNNLI